MAKVSPSQSQLVDYFYGDGLDFTAQELGYAEVPFQKGDEISVEEYYDIPFKDFYRILDIKPDQYGRIVATVAFVRTNHPNADSLS